MRSLRVRQNERLPHEYPIICDYCSPVGAQAAINPTGRIAAAMLSTSTQTKEKDFNDMMRSFEGRMVFTSSAINKKTHSGVFSGYDLKGRKIDREISPLDVFSSMKDFHIYEAVLHVLDQIYDPVANDGYENMIYKFENIYHPNLIHNGVPMKGGDVIDEIMTKNDIEYSPHLSHKFGKGSLDLVGIVGSTGSEFHKFKRFIPPQGGAILKRRYLNPFAEVRKSVELMWEGKTTHSIQQSDITRRDWGRKKDRC